MTLLVKTSLANCELYTDYLSWKESRIIILALFKIPFMNVIEGRKIENKGIILIFGVSNNES